MPHFTTGHSTTGTRTARAHLWAAPAMLVATFLAGCAQQPVASHIVPQTFGPPTQTAQSAPPASSSTPDRRAKQNDPSAAHDTPLCGTAAREAMAMAVQNYPQPLTSGNACTQNACYNTQTGTYIAADGTQRVCR